MSRLAVTGTAVALIIASVWFGVFAPAVDTIRADLNASFAPSPGGAA